jgi:hypothetical protein
MTSDAVFGIRNPSLIFARRVRVTARALQARIRMQFVAERDRLRDGFGRIFLREGQTQKQRGEQSE